jgi:hypothetical protein
MSSGKLDRERASLEEGERLLCSPAVGTFFPWTAFVGRNRLVRRLLAAAVSPLTLLFFGGGLRALFILTDSRLIVRRKLKSRAISLPLSSVVPLEDDSGELTGVRNWFFDVHSEIFELKLLVQDRGELRLRFGHRQMVEGSEMANVLFRQYSERSSEEARAFVARIGDSDAVARARRSGTSSGNE